MQVRMVKMYRHGVELERRMLNDRSTPQHRGKLVIMDITDQGRHRPVKVARLLSARGIECELQDVHVVWLNDNRFTFTGDERNPGPDGKAICYKQSWLCTLDTDPPLDGDTGGPDRKFQLPAK